MPLVPHKLNASRRHQFEKKRCRITNWSSDTESLRRRGEVTVWRSPDAEAARRRTRGGQAVYSDLAVAVCLTLGPVFKQSLRQTERFVRGLVGPMDLDIPVADDAPFSRRGAGPQRVAFDQSRAFSRQHEAAFAVANALKQPAELNATWADLADDIPASAGQISLQPSGPIRRCPMDQQNAPPQRRRAASRLARSTTPEQNFTAVRKAKDGERMARPFGSDQVRRAHPPALRRLKARPAAGSAGAWPGHVAFN